jgi:uncharacterized protein YjbI with pentapeptide repeats
MKLNKDGRIEQRKRVEAKLRDIEFNPNKRIKLDKERLLELLFDPSSKDENGNVYNKFSFYSDNLCKLDLSEISSFNVSFNSSEKYLNLSNTNMDINFELSYEFLCFEQLIIRNTSFKNVDLSEISFCSLTKNMKGIMENCDLSNTNLKLKDVDNRILFFKNCNLSNNDFSGLKFYTDMRDDEFILVESCGGDIELVNCNIANTGIDIFVEDFMAEDEQKGLKDMIDKGYFDGCYLNGIKIVSPDEKINNAIKLEEEYKKYKAERINSTLDMIDAQLSHDGGRQSKPKLNKSTGASSFYGCDNVKEVEDDYKGSYPTDFPKTPKKTLKKTVKREGPKNPNTINTFLNDDLDD